MVLHRLEEAAEEFREAVRINPNNAWVHGELGSLLTKLNRFEEAERNTEKQ